MMNQQREIIEKNQQHILQLSKMRSSWIDRDLSLLRQAACTRNKSHMRRIDRESVTYVPYCLTSRALFLSLSLSMTDRALIRFASMSRETCSISPSKVWSSQWTSSRSSDIFCALFQAGPSAVLALPMSVARRPFKDCTANIQTPNSPFLSMLNLQFVNTSRQGVPRSAFAYSIPAVYYARSIITASTLEYTTQSPTELSSCTNTRLSNQRASAILYFASACSWASIWGSSITLKRSCKPRFTKSNTSKQLSAAGNLTWPTRSWILEWNIQLSSLSEEELDDVFEKYQGPLS